jgi:hypothetical protein
MAVRAIEKRANRNNQRNHRHLGTQKDLGSSDNGAQPPKVSRSTA